MTVGEICTRHVRTVRPDHTVREAAHRLRDDKVGCLVVVGGEGPVEGIITDRDIVVRLVAEGRSADAALVSDVMTRGMVATTPDTPVERALELMAEREVRRLVVTDEQGTLVGVLALDDVLSLLSKETASVARLIRGQVAV